MNSEETRQQEAAKQQVMLKQIEMIENVAKQCMTSEALSRYGNVRVAHPEKAMQIAAFIAQAAQNKQLQAKITDAQLKELLTQMQPQERPTRINKR